MYSAIDSMHTTIHVCIDSNMSKGTKVDYSRMNPFVTTWHHSLDFSCDLIEPHSLRKGGFFCPLRRGILTGAASMARRSDPTGEGWEGGGSLSNQVWLYIHIYTVH